jgi:hypothetical protein
MGELYSMRIIKEAVTENPMEIHKLGLKALDKEQVFTFQIHYSFFKTKPASSLFILCARVP